MKYSMEIDSTLFDLLRDGDTTITLDTTGLNLKSGDRVKFIDTGENQIPMEGQFLLKTKATGRTLTKTITYVIRGEKYGLQPNEVRLGFKL